MAQKENNILALNIKVDDLAIHFGDNIALNNVNLDIKAGTFFTLLGPSGCGKTTLLRSIAGFTPATKGSIFFNDKNITSIPAWERNIGFVFQNYALWPNKTIFNNIAYGLKLRKFSKEEIKKRTEAILDIVHLKKVEKKYPSELSGGMQQRVALARALVINPPLLLLDEPLSNLDAKLRITLRKEIRQIQQKLGITAIYVTHDQEEALDISDSIAVMSKGRIEQVGGAREIYENPKSSFVANFIGNANFMEGKKISENQFQLKNQQIIHSQLYQPKQQENPQYAFVRPENIQIVSQKEAQSIKAIITDKRYYGNISHYNLCIYDDIFLTMESQSDFSVGETLWISFENLILFNDKS